MLALHQLPVVWDDSMAEYEVEVRTCVTRFPWPLSRHRPPRRGCHSKRFVLKVLSSKRGGLSMGPSGRDPYNRPDARL